MSVAEATARAQRFARALELLAEMQASVGLPETNGVPVAVDYPAGHFKRPVAEQRAWLIANPAVYAEPGDPEQLAAAIERAHSQWKASKA